MPPTPLYPLRFDPILKELVWGGRRLASVLGKPLGPGSRYAESWEIADHREDVSRVVEGALAGASLRDLLAERGPEVLGGSPAPRGGFPLLVKYIDAHQVLSVQVHPDDERGLRLAGDSGKTEAWVVLHAEPGSLIYAGLRPGVTRSHFAEALASGEVEPLLHRFEAEPGQCIHIPAGTVHAIGAGVVLAEIQQMSDATFRLHDWGRVGNDGKPRTLHLAEALESTDFDAGAVQPWQSSPEPTPCGTRQPLASCPFFQLERLVLRGPAEVGRPDRFTILLGLGGEAEVRHGATVTPLALGQTLLLPAALGACSVVPRDESTILSCVVP